MEREKLSEPEDLQSVLVVMRVVMMLPTGQVQPGQVLTEPLREVVEASGIGQLRSAEVHTVTRPTGT